MGKSKSPWLDFESSLAGWMAKFANDKLAFKNGNQAIPGFPSNGFRADGLLTDGETLLAIEVEVAQTHPDTNVGKIRRNLTRMGGEWNWENSTLLKVRQSRMLLLD